jgi:hypothetical protein
MSKLTELVRERRRRQENPNRIAVIFHTFVDPVTKSEIPMKAAGACGSRIVALYENCGS